MLIKCFNELTRAAIRLEFEHCYPQNQLNEISLAATIQGLDPQTLDFYHSS